MSDQPLRQPAGLARVFDDWWNPILVKEVRQALRGKVFRVSFVLVLIAVVIVTLASVVDMGSSVDPFESREFFFGVMVCLSIAVVGLVPFTTFNAMGAEWDENTYDLLVISNLRPRQILIGKMLSAGVQALLYYSAFTPFLAFAFLLRGIDLLAATVLLGGGLVVSCSLAMFALMLSTFSRVRMLRIFFMALLAAALTGMVSWAGVMTDELMRRPGSLRDREAVIALTAFATVCVVFTSLCLAIGCNMLAHREENRSTGVRVLFSITTFIAMGFMAWLAVEVGMKEAVSAMTIGLLVWLVPAGIFFVSEEEKLGRRVTPRVPKNPLYALLIAPWLPGGSRGLILIMLHMALILGACAWGHLWLASPGTTFWEDGMLSVLFGSMYVILYLGLPSGVLSRFTGNPKLRAAVRVLIPLCALLLAFAPAVVGFFLDQEDLMEMEHGGHPFFVGERMWNNGVLRFPATWIGIGVIVTLTLILNAPRIHAGVMEVIDASLVRRRASRSAQAVATAPAENPASD